MLLVLFVMFDGFLLFVTCCSVCVAIIFVRSRPLRSQFVLSFDSLYVLAVTVVLLRLFDFFDTLVPWCGYVFRVVLYAWRLSWSCRCVSDRGLLCPLLL